MLDPATYASQGSEHAHQVAIFMWAAQPESRRLYPDLPKLYAIPNGGERNKAVASRLKAEGVKPGVPDLCLPVARGGFFGLYIEMKKPKTPGKRAGRASDEQLARMEQLAEDGYAVYLRDTWDGARDVLVWYLSQERTLR